MIRPLLFLPKDRFLQSRSDFVHRPAAALASLYFQNDFFLAVLACCACSFVVVRIGRKAECVVLVLGFSPPEVYNKGDPFIATQDPSLIAIVG